MLLMHTTYLIQSCERANLKERLIICKLCSKLLSSLHFIETYWQTFCINSRKSVQTFKSHNGLVADIPSTSESTREIAQGAPADWFIQGTKGGPTCFCRHCYCEYSSPFSSSDISYSFPFLLFLFGIVKTLINMKPHDQ